MRSIMSSKLRQGRRRKKRQPRGFILIMALLVITGVLLQVEIGLTRSITELRATNLFLSRQQAFQLAEAGLDAKIAQLLDADASNDSATLQQTLSTGENYSVTLTNLGSAAWQLTSVGTATPNTSQTLQMVVEIIPVLTFQEAIFGTQKVEVKGSTVLVDSYDSRLGAYGASIVPSDPVYGSTNQSMPGNPQSFQGSIRTNSTSAQAMPIHDGANIFGNATTGAGGDPATVIQVTDGAIVWGSQSAAASNLTLDPVVVPPGVPNSGALSLSGPTTVTLSAGTYFFDSITVTGGANLLTDGQVTIYVLGKVGIQNGSVKGQINGVDNPSALSLLSLSSLLQNDMRVLQSTFVGTAYMPGGELSIENSAQVFGSVIVANVQTESGSQVHFDEALKTVSANQSSAQLHVRLWKE